MGPFTPTLQMGKLRQRGGNGAVCERCGPNPTRGEGGIWGAAGEPPPHTLCPATHRHPLLSFSPPQHLRKSSSAGGNPKPLPRAGAPQNHRRAVPRAVPRGGVPFSSPTPRRDGGPQ